MLGSWDQGICQRCFEEGVVRVGVWSKTKENIRIREWKSKSKSSTEDMATSSGSAIVVGGSLKARQARAGAHGKKRPACASQTGVVEDSSAEGLGFRVFRVLGFRIRV